MADSAVIVVLPPIDPDQVEIGRRLRRLREGRGIAAPDLARAMRLGLTALRMAEQGRARLTSSQLYAATLALRIPMRLFFEGEIETVPTWPASL